MSSAPTDICIVGRFPPPLGGVSVYCSRRYAALRAVSPQARRIDFSDRRWPLRLAVDRSATYEVNSLNLWIVAVFFALGKLPRCVFVDHNASRHYAGWRKRVLLGLLRSARQVSVVKKDLLSFYPAHFVTDVVSPFLPPQEAQLAEAMSGYPPDVLAFIGQGRFLVNSAWRYTPHGDGDLYGLVDSIRLLEALPDARLLMAIGNPASVPDTLLDRAQRFVQAGRLCLLTGQQPLWPVFTRDAVCLRLTPTDGDSVTVKEALHFDCPVVASDSIVRPPGCTVYRYGDMDDLVRRTRQLLEGPGPCPDTGGSHRRS